MYRRARSRYGGVSDETRSHSGVRIDDRGWGRYVDGASIRMTGGSQRTFMKIGSAGRPALILLAAKRSEGTLPTEDSGRFFRRCIADVASRPYHIGCNP